MAEQQRDIDTKRVPNEKDYEVVIPPFADEQNRLLAQEITRKRIELFKLIAETKEQEERKKAMTAHRDTVLNEIQQSTSLLTAKKRQVETEKHLYELSKREAGALETDIKNVERDLKEVSRQIAELGNMNEREKGTIEDLKTQMKLSQTEYENWVKEHKDKEQDHLALDKYTKDDARRITDLNVKLKRLTSEVAKRKSQLHSKMAASEEVRADLEAATDNYKNLQQERQELVQKWEAALVQVEKRSNEAEVLKQKKIALDTELTKLRVTYNGLQTQYDDIQEEMKNSELKITDMERRNAQLTTTLNNKYQEVEDLKIEVEIAKSALKSLQHSIRTQKKSNNDMESDVAEKKAALEKEKAKKVEAEQKLALIKSEALSVQEKSKRVEEMLSREVARRKNLDKELKDCRSELYRRNQELAHVKSEQKSLEQELQSTKTSLKAAKTTRTKLETQSLIQETLLYNHSFEVQQMERKLRRAQGERSKEETAALKKRITELENHMEHLKKQVSELNAENRQSIHDIKRSKRILENLSQGKERVEGELAELALQIESATRQLARKTADKEELVVEESLLKLEFKKLQGQYESKNNDKLTAEARQNQLKFLIEERIREIEAYKDVLRVEAKLAEEERFSNSTQLRDAISKVEKLKKKYEVVMMSIGLPEMGEEPTQAYYIVKAAEDKERLRQEVSTIQEQVKFAEGEVNSLEETLRLMVEQNEGLRHAIKAQRINEEEKQLKEDLEQKSKDLMETYKTKRSELSVVETEMKELQERISIEEQTNSAQEETLTALKTDIQKLESEIQNQRSKQERAEKMAAKAQKEYRAAMKVQGISAEEEDIKIKELKEENRAIFTAISSIAEKDPKLQQKFQDYCESEGISAPPSRSESTTSNPNAPARTTSRTNIRTVSPARAGRATPSLIEVGKGLEAALNIGSGGGGLKEKPGAWKPASKIATKPKSTNHTRNN